MKLISAMWTDTMLLTANGAVSGYVAAGQPVGFQCCGCARATYSRCRTCDEATCGNCLPRHECEGAA